MPLSEQEQRLLDEMERHLMHNDADVVTASRDGRTLSYRNIVYGTVLVLLGLGGLIAGVAIPLVVVGVIGFVVMLGGVILAVTPTRGGGSRTARAGKAPKAPKSNASFMDRMNDRWDKRQDDR
jgi:membrane-associated phospholipid phosphatase